MRRSLFVSRMMVFLIVISIAASMGLAGDYEITKVIEIGPCDGTPMTWPLKWSPDGTKLAYFNNNSLYLSDTLGNTREIVRLDPYPHRYEWLSDNEIVIQIYNHLTEPQTFKLLKLDINNGQVDILEEFTRALGVRHNNDPNSFRGPFLTIEGRLYYRTNVLRANIIDSKINSEPRPVVSPRVNIQLRQTVFRLKNIGLWCGAKMAYIWYMVILVIR